MQGVGRSAPHQGGGGVLLVAPSAWSQCRLHVEAGGLVWRRVAAEAAELSPGAPQPMLDDLVDLGRVGGVRESASFHLNLGHFLIWLQQGHSEARAVPSWAGGLLDCEGVVHCCAGATAQADVGAALRRRSP